MLNGSGPEGAITIVQAHEYAILAEGVRLILEAQADMQVLAVAEDGVHMVAECQRLQPRVALMSDTLATLSGVEAARQIKQSMPGCHVVFLSKHSAPDIVARALRAGVTAYVVKDASAAELVQAVRSAAKGIPFFSPSIASLIVTDYVRLLQGEDENDPYQLLSEGERHVLQMVAEGYTGPQIASRLYITTKAVEKTRQRLMKKLDVRDMAGLVRAAIRMGLVAE